MKCGSLSSSVKTAVKALLKPQPASVHVFSSHPFFAGALLTSASSRHFAAHLSQRPSAKLWRISRRHKMWSLADITSFLSFGRKKDESSDKVTRSRMKATAMDSTAQFDDSLLQTDDALAVGSEYTSVSTADGDESESEEDSEDYAPCVVTDEKGRIRFQRNVPGKAIVYEGFEVQRLENPKKKKGRVWFRDWNTCRQAIMKCPSATQGKMPLRKEVLFIYPRLKKAIHVHGGWPQVAKRLGLKPHRVAPYFIPYLSEDEQYKFVEENIHKYNAVRRKQQSSKMTK